MPMNRVQFQPGLSLPEFTQRYGAEAQCEAALAQRRWPTGFCCPACGHRGHGLLPGRPRMPFQCNARHRQTSLIAGTLFQGANLPLTTWFLAIYLLSQAKTGLADPPQADTCGHKCRPWPNAKTVTGCPVRCRWTNRII